ncbi:hypothetical protein STFE110948_06975 [Streptobacillus felis]|uniref:hypothetical protein n=1 Tax=Streptobacillus felis TaxID=1384509 RepID=UPI000829898C|nr:hypothetical protein [Streptobacillus felis]
MKEFYLKKNNKNEIIFFFREKTKNSSSKEIWMQKIDENSKINDLDSNATFNKLLCFLEVKNKIIHTLDDVNITIWRGEEYKITKIEMNKQITGLQFSIADENYICTENEIYIINQNNSINERLV